MFIEIILQFICLSDAAGIQKHWRSCGLNPDHTSNIYIAEATLSNATSRTSLSTKSNVALTLLLVWTGLYSVNPFFTLVVYNALYKHISLNFFNHAGALPHPSFVANLLYQFYLFTWRCCRKLTFNNDPSYSNSSSCSAALHTPTDKFTILHYTVSQKTKTKLFSWPPRRMPGEFSHSFVAVINLTQF